MTKETQDIEVKTAAPDPHYPHQNQAKYCYSQYIAYWRCVGDNGDDESADVCHKYRKAYTSMCPDKWKNSWDEQRANGNMALPYRTKPAH